MIRFFNDQCQDCMESYHPAVYDFHHRDPAQKDFRLSRASETKWDLVEIELNKCDMLCSDCHRIRHINLPSIVPTHQDKTIINVPKKCSQCGEVKDREDFHDRQKNKHNTCRKCSSRNRVSSQKSVKEAWIKYKGGKCQKCSKTGDPVIFDFHHRDPKSKAFALSTVRFNKFSDRTILELNKCDLLCSNCHRMETFIDLDSDAS